VVRRWAHCLSVALISVGMLRAEAPAVLPVVRLSSADLPSAERKEREKESPAQKELSVDALVERVLAQNPTLAQMSAAADAAQARYPQVTALEDPMFGASFGPGSIGANSVDFAYRLEVSQKLPYPGKRALRGRNAAAEAAAAGDEIEDAQLMLIESARSAFYDYYLAERALEVNREALRLLGEFKQNAEARYKTGQVPQSDVLQSDVENGRQRERELALERARRVAVARINTLMHLPPDAPLPPPPRELKPMGGVPDAAALRALAIERRPDLRALANRVVAEQAALDLARREYKPDFEVMAAYDAFWQETPLRTMLGVRINLPVRKARRNGAVAEAAARLAQRQAELARRSDEVNYEVQQGYERFRESERALKLYEVTILPAARENVKAAQTAYVTAKVPFLSLIEAQRSFIELQDRAYETTAEYFRRRAALERAAGGPLSTTR
jgi:outer membrane protein, heavy metal efflux system